MTGHSVVNDDGEIASACSPRDVRGILAESPECPHTETIPFTDHCIRGKIEGLRCNCGRILKMRIVR